MGGLSIWHWLIVLVIVVLLFGRGRIGDIMGDFGKGIKSFKKGIADEDAAPAPRLSETPPPAPAASPQPSGEPRQL